MKQIILLFGIIILGTFEQATAQAFFRNNSSLQTTQAKTRIMTMFPNPATNHTTIVLNYIPAQRTVVDIVDYNGHIRQSFQFSAGGNQLSFDLSSLERGYYIVRVREAARLVDIAKLVKA
ncbi:MAG TPA: T9SS type A sorting domain-containing protein [Flavipsychrobacter sp.]|mgnify:CR=1 FL=1|nr:T9SS type A sorting domain-containing protein [Flavipsychrobacter sp.]